MYSYIQQVGFTKGDMLFNCKQRQLIRVTELFAYVDIRARESIAFSLALDRGGRGLPSRSTHTLSWRGIEAVTLRSANEYAVPTCIGTV